MAQTNGLQKQIENDEKLKLPGPDELVSSATFDSEKGRTDLHENGEIIRDNKEEEPLVSNVFIN